MNLRKTDLVPFKLLKNEKMVMLAHIIYKDIDDEVATYSKVITKDVLRGLMSFKGLILSDDLSMKALSGELITKVKKTYDAGCDVVLYCHGNIEEMQEIYPYSRIIKQNYYDYFISKKKTKFLKNDILKN